MSRASRGVNWRARARARACVCVGMRCDNLIVAPPPAVPAICPRFAGVQWCEALVAVISQRGECVDIGLHAAAVDAAATMVRYFSESKKVRHMGVCASMHACVCACVCVRLGEGVGEGAYLHPRTGTCWQCQCQTRQPLRHWSRAQQSAWQCVPAPWQTEGTMSWPWLRW